MNKSNNGKYLEKLIALIEDVLKPHEKFTIHENVKLEDKDGNKRQIDVLVEVQGSPRLGNYKIIIETKNWNKRIEIGIVGSFLDLLDRLNISKGIIVSKLGFQKGAIQKANGTQKVLLYTFRDTNDNELIKWMGRNFYQIIPTIKWDKEISGHFNIKGKSTWSLDELNRDGEINIKGTKQRFSIFFGIQVLKIINEELRIQIGSLLNNRSIEKLPKEIELNIKWSNQEGFEVSLNSELGTLLGFTIKVSIELKIIQGNNYSKNNYGELNKEHLAEVLTVKFEEHNYVVINSKGKSRKEYVIPHNLKNKTLEVIKFPIE